MLRRLGLRWRTVLLYSAFIVCVLYFVVDFYLLSIQKNEMWLRDSKRANSHYSKIATFTKSTNVVPASYVAPNVSDVLQGIVNRLVKSLLPCEACEREVPWNVSYPWLDSRHVHPENVPMLGRVLRRMSTAKITLAKAGKGGTQLKLFLWLEGGQKVVFKPMRFSRHDVIQGQPYAGADRHNGEIAAFHLNRLLDFRRGPIVVGRKVNVRTQLMPVSEVNLLKTFVVKDNRTCFYGICHYCNPLDLVCADENNELEGAIILWLPPTVKLKARRHPWSRTYRDGVKALWETHDDFCNSVKALDLYSSGTLLLDIIDAAIFDYLIGNADRHRYEVLDGVDNSMLLLLDNGKRIRHSTWQRLQLLDQESLASSLKKMMSYDPLSPILTGDHMNALNRRLEKVKQIVLSCGTTNRNADVFLDNMTLVNEL